MGEKPENVLVYCKPFDEEVLISFMAIYEHILSEFKMCHISVDQWVIDEIKALSKDKQTSSIQNGVYPYVFINTGEEMRETIDFILTLGGDGTILWASK
jgi:NAD kinase